MKYATDQVIAKHNEETFRHLQPFHVTFQQNADDQATKSYKAAHV